MKEWAEPLAIVAIIIVLPAISFALGVISSHGGEDTILLSRDEWHCADVEPDGCAEYRRYHNHPLSRSAHQ